MFLSNVNIHLYTLLELTYLASYLFVFKRTQAPRLTTLRFKRSSGHFVVIKMTVQTSWSACLKLYALQVSSAWLKYSCIAIFTASTGVPMLFKNIFLTASKSTVGPLRLQDHLYNCSKSQQLNHCVLNIILTTAKNQTVEPLRLQDHL